MISNFLYLTEFVFFQHAPSKTWRNFAFCPLAGARGTARKKKQNHETAFISSCRNEK